MGRLNSVLTPDDLRKGELVEPGWHPAEFVSYEEKDAETDGSLNIILGFKILDGPGKGITVNRLFNEKALGFGKNLWKTWGFPFDPNVGLKVTSDMIESKKGSKLRIYIKRGKSNKGNEFNDAADFQPFTTA